MINNSKKKSPWIKIFQEKNNSDFRLFCFHYAGGGASAYRDWGPRIPSSVELAAIQLPGRENRFREKPVKNLDELLDLLVDNLIDHFDKPFGFWGHSMGALISYELTKKLKSRSMNIPEHLFVSGRPSPSVPRRMPPIHNLSEELFVEEIKKFGGIPEAILDDEETRSFFFPTLRADLELCEKYRYQSAKPIRIPISVYNGLSDSGVNAFERNEWKDMTSAACEFKLFAGGHFYFKESEKNFFDQLNSDLRGIVSKVNLKSSSKVFTNKPQTY